MESFREAYGVLQRHAQTLRNQDEPNIDDLLTIVTGSPGSGKSIFLDNWMLNLAKWHDWTFAVCSPENQPLERHAAGMRGAYSLSKSAPRESFGVLFKLLHQLAHLLELL